VNLYLVVSEELSYIDVIDRGLGGPRVYYRITELVAARNHAQARYIAWRADIDGDTGWSIKFMPKFAVRLKRKDVDWPAGIVTDEYQMDQESAQDKRDILAFDALWDIGHAPHIGYHGRSICQTDQRL